MTLIPTDLVQGSLISEGHGRNVARFTFLSWGSLLFCVGIVFIVRAGGGNNAKPSAEDEHGHSSAIAADPSPQYNTKPSRIETEIVTIRLDGFEPKQIARAQGRFILAVDNRSGLDVVSLTLGRNAGPLLHQVTVPKETLDWAQGLDLAPGHYLLKEANNPDWVCELIITP